MHGGHGRVPGGLGRLHRRKKIQGVEAGGAEHAAAAEETPRGPHQPVYMEQGHNVERAVALRQLERPCGVVSRLPDIGLGQRHHIRARGRARVCRIKATSSVSAWPGHAATPVDAPDSRTLLLQTDALASALEAQRRAFRRPQSRSSRCPPRQSAPLLRGRPYRTRIRPGDRRVERRRGRGAGDGQKRSSHLRSVRQHDRDAIAASDAEVVQRSHRSIDKRAQRVIGQRRASSAAMAVASSRPNSIRARNVRSALIFSPSKLKRTRGSFDSPSRSTTLPIASRPHRPRRGAASQYWPIDQAR